MEQQVDLNNDIDIFVAARCEAPPSFPLREELVPLGIECILYESREETNNTQKAKNNTKALSRKDLLNLERGKNRETLNKEHNVEDKFLNDIVGATIEHEAFDSSTAASTLTMLGVKGDDSLLRSKNRIPVEPKKSKPQHIRDDNIADLSHTSHKEMDGMTNDTFLLAGKPFSDTDSMKVPRFVFAKAKEDDLKWWYETNDFVINPRKIVKQLEEGNMSKIKKRGKHKDPIIEKEIVIHQHENIDSALHTDDLSTIEDSTCEYVNNNPDALVSESDNLAWEIDNDNDIELVKRYILLRSTNSKNHNVTDGSLSGNANSLDMFHSLQKWNNIKQTSSFTKTDFLFSMLKEAHIKPEEVKMFIDQNPETVTVSRKDDKKQALHILCDRHLPSHNLILNYEKKKNAEQQSRISEEEKSMIHSIITNLIEDITMQRVMLKIVAWANISAVCTSDKNGDLPLHILTRKLLKWMSDIQQFIGCDGMDVSGLARIATISNTVSECISVMLRPVALNSKLHSARGSIGIMLPIHISLIFSSSFDTFRLLLDTRTSDSSVAYIPGETMPAQHFLPIEILEKMKHDRKKYETIMNKGYGRLTGKFQWPSSIPDNACAQDLVRRSDMLFALHPNILPYRKDTSRLRRIESLIRSEAKQNGMQFSAAVKSIWLWLCTYHDAIDVHENYIENISRVVAGLKPAHLNKLYEIKTKNGRQLLQEATERVKAVLSEARDEAERRESSLQIPNQMVDTKGALYQGETLEKNNVDESKQQGIATLCNAIFDVKEESIPTSFVIFPFKLRSSTNGSRTLVSEVDAPLAVEYAKILLTFASADAIVETLQEKVWEKQGEEKMKTRETVRIKSELAEISKIYGEKVGYLYFLDEETGTPVTKTIDGHYPEYPISITNPIPIIEKLLPLMRKGMALMRRSRIIAVFTKVVTESSFEKFPYSWIGAAQQILQFPYNKPIGDGNSEKHIIIGEDSRHKLLHLISEASGNINIDDSKHTYKLGWAKEISILRDLIEKSDLNSSGVEQSLGLNKVRLERGGFIWTRKKGQYGICHYTQDNDRKEISDNEKEGKTASKSSDQNIHSFVKKEIDNVNQRIARINEFLEMNDVEDLGFVGGLDGCEIDFGANDNSKLKNGVKPGDNNRFTPSSSKNAAVYKFESNTTETHTLTTSSSSSEEIDTKGEKVSRAQKLPDTNPDLFERTKMMLRVRNAQLAKYEETLCLLTSADSILTIYAIEKAILSLNNKIDAYEKKVNVKDVKRKLLAERKRCSHRTKANNIFSVLETLIVKKEAKIESIKNSVKKREVALLSERLEI